MVKGTQNLESKYGETLFPNSHQDTHDDSSKEYFQNSFLEHKYNNIQRRVIKKYNILRL